MNDELLIPESTTPPALITHGVRFVFYFVPHPVMDTFDNIPQFHLDVVEKKDPANIRRLYICCKFPKAFQFDHTKDTFELSVEIATAFTAYLKKHFTSKFSIINTMVPLDVGLIVFHLLQQKKLLEEDVLYDYFVATSPNKDGNTLTKAGPALLSQFEFIFSSSEDMLPKEGLDVIAFGNGILFGEPVVFAIVDRRNTLFKVFAGKELLAFINSSLVEDTINRTMRISMGHPANSEDRYLFDVKLEPIKPVEI